MCQGENTQHSLICCTFAVFTPFVIRFSSLLLDLVFMELALIDIESSLFIIFILIFLLNKHDHGQVLNSFCSCLLEDTNLGALTRLRTRRGRCLSRRRSTKKPRCGTQWGRYLPSNGVLHDEQAYTNGNEDIQRLQENKRFKHEGF